MIKQIKGLIFPALILTIVASFYLLNKDINEYSQIVEEQQVQIDTLKKQLGYHDIRISGQQKKLNLLLVKLVVLLEN
jgi:uncharacterized coiled-coil protein SlyX